MCPHPRTSRMITTVPRTQEVAADALVLILENLAILPLPQPLYSWSSSRIVQLGSWTNVEAATCLWLRAAPNALKLVSPEDFRRGPKRVSRWDDISGHGNHASQMRFERMPEFIPDALGEGQGALEFTGHRVLETLPFTTPLPQPLTIMLVARASGDVTLCDSLKPTSSRFECAAAHNARPRP